MDNLLTYITHFMLITGTLISYGLLVFKVYMIKGLAWAIGSALIPLPVIPYMAWKNWQSLNFHFLVLSFFLLIWLLVLFKIIKLEYKGPK
jgi:hypothetical protein